MAMVPYKEADERALTVDNAGSGLVMRREKVLGKFQAATCLTPGVLTYSQRLARTDLLQVEGAQITEVETGITYEVKNGGWELGPDARIQASVDAAAQAAAAAQVSLGSSGLTATQFDGSGRVIAFTLSGVSYTVTGWGTSSLTITGGNGLNRAVTLDGSGRFLTVG